MTKRIRVSLGSESVSTAISNIFIDKYMADANGSYVKVYIYLMRCLSDPSMDVSVSDFSEKLDETEKDIIRALEYWEDKNLLSISYDEDGQISNMTITPLSGMPAVSKAAPGVSSDDRNASIDPARRRSASVRRRTAGVACSEEEPAEDFAPVSMIDEGVLVSPSPEILKAPNYTPSQIASLKEYDDFENLIVYVENKLGTLNQTKLNSLAFIYEILDMNSELIRYLYDYCFCKKKTGSKYIESVAIAWKGKEIDTVEKARQETFSRSKECSAVKNSFGLQRSLGGVELEYISRWCQEYGMTHELIKEACDRTLMQTSKPDFKYADKILQDWKANGVSTLEDVAGLDREYRTKNAPSGRRQTDKAKTSAAPNNFSLFPQRSYSDKDYAELERKKISSGHNS